MWYMLGLIDVYALTFFITEISIIIIIIISQLYMFSESY